VNAFPTIVFISPESGEIDRKTGFRNADSMLKWIEEVRKNETTIAALSAKLEDNPTDLEALLGQAQNYLDAGGKDKALELIAKAEEIAPGDARVLALLGQSHLKSGEFDKAETAIDAALDADENNDQARRMKIALLLSRADVSLIKNKAAEAMIPLSEVLRMEPENFDALIGAGRALFKLNEPAGAQELLRKASKIRPNSPLPHESLGNYYAEAEDEARAEQEYLKAIEIEPRYNPPYFRLIELYEKQGKRPEMMEMYSRVLPLDPSGAHNEIAWLMATSEHEHIRDPETAIEHALIAIELKPHTWYIDTLAEAFYAAGRYDAAIAVIKEAIAKKPDDIKYYEDQLDKFNKAKAEQEGKEEN
jgi:tetratricopeptide (TPR) repeat protein